jgi:hypothetical protein
MQAEDATVQNEDKTLRYVNVSNEEQSRPFSAARASPTPYSKPYQMSIEQWVLPTILMQSGYR